MTIIPIAENDFTNFLIKIPQFKKQNGNLYQITSFDLLFGCGFNTFKFISDNNIKIDYVFIPNTHLYNIGGLEFLINYSYENEHKITILINKLIKDELEHILKDLSYVYENGRLKPKEKFYIIEDLQKLCKLFSNYKFQFIKANYPIKNSYGLIIYNNDENKSVLFTGDTKAFSGITDLINKIVIINGYQLFIFHDFNLINDPYKNPHCCENDFNYFYGKDLYMKNYYISWFKYKNSEFNKKYEKKEIFPIIKD